MTPYLMASYMTLNVLVFIWSLRQDHRDFTWRSWVLSTALALTVGAPLVLIIFIYQLIKDAGP